MASEVSVPFRGGREGYASFRIPAVVGSRAGALLAFCEGRVASASDAGNIDIVLKRSIDGGRTWSPLAVVARNADHLAGNPAPVALADGRVLLVHVRNAGGATEARIRRGQVPAAEGRRVYVMHSDDDGLTWSSPREITAQTKRASWRWYATTPGHAIQLASGRIVVPANHSLPPAAGSGDDGTEGHYNGGHCLLSDDRGQNWRIGYVDGHEEGAIGLINVNETTAAQLPDGRVYFNTRNDSPAPGNRAEAWSKDGGQTLVKAFRPQACLTGPVVEGSVLQLDGGPLLYSGPADPGHRALMTIRASTDNGSTWRATHTVSGVPAAYSDLVRIDADTLGLLYETGDFGAYETITFRRIPLTRVLP